MTIRFLAILASAGLMTAGVASAAETRSGAAIPSAPHGKSVGSRFAFDTQWRDDDRRGSKGHHSNGHGRGHYSHGNGHGYGHGHGHNDSCG